MPDYYCETSSMLYIKDEHTERARAITDRVSRGIEEEYGYLGCEVLIEDKREEKGVWFTAGPDCNLDQHHVALIAEALLNELEIDEPFIFSYSYGSSKPVLDEFGGGAAIVKRGYETYFCNPVEEVTRMEKEGRLKKLEDSK